MSDKKVSFFVVIVVALITFITFSNLLFSSQTDNHVRVKYSDFLQQVNDNDIKQVLIDEDHVTFLSNKGLIEEAYGPTPSSVVSELTKNKASVSYAHHDRTFFNWLPIILFAIFLLFPFFTRNNMMKKVSGISKGKNVVIDPSKNDVTFKDVAGADEAKYELEEIVQFLKNPGKYELMGGKIPRGVIMEGPPGTGKTLLAKAVAGEAGVPFYSMSGSDFVEMFVGVGASRVRSLFEEARKNSPCIIFIDEIDAVCKKRGNSAYATNDEREQTVNQFLVEMDGFKSAEGRVIVIGATNRIDTLDPALLRPGRFDRKVTLGNPDILGRRQILAVHTKAVPLAEDVNLDRIARATPGFSGAELANLVNEAIIFATRDDRKTVGMMDFENARDKCMLGAEKKSMIMSEEEKKITSYHEGGHALCGLLLTAGDPLHKVTIIPRGNALGLTYSLPLESKLSYTIEYIKAKLIMTMGGRAAEEIIFGAEKVSNGASGDIKQATQLAKLMVTEWGMSENLGLVSYDMDNFRGTSEATTSTIEAEIKGIIQKAYKDALDLLNQYKYLLDVLSAHLIDNETLSAEEIVNLPEFKETGLKFNVALEEKIDRLNVVASQGENKNG